MVEETVLGMANAGPKKETGMKAGTGTGETRPRMVKAGPGKVKTNH